MWELPIFMWDCCDMISLVCTSGATILVVNAGSSSGACPSKITSSQSLLDAGNTSLTRSLSLESSVRPSAIHSCTVIKLFALGTWPCVTPCATRYTGIACLSLCTCTVCVARS